MGLLKFTINSTDGNARAGTLELKHGIVKTPAFIPVATKAYVKSLALDDLIELDPHLLICNTLHLMLYPGPDYIKNVGGLHTLMSWKKPLITDSGGFQVFSLGAAIDNGTNKIIISDDENLFEERIKTERNLSKKKERPEVIVKKITEEGVNFSLKRRDREEEHLLSPERSINIQEQLGADMILAFDECTCPTHGREYTIKSLKRTHRWACRSFNAHTTDQAIIGIVQGGEWQDLREKSAHFITKLPFDGYAIGGSLGKTKKRMYEVITWVNSLLPKDKPRHLLGVGVVEDLFEGVERGVDLFDCVTPTRWGRYGYAYVNQPLGNKSNKYRCKITAKTCYKNESPLDERCACKVCTTYTRDQIYHNFLEDKLLGGHLLSYHNVHFFLQLMRDIQHSIEESRFHELKREWGL